MCGARGGRVFPTERSATTPADLGLQPVPQRRRRVQQEEVHFASLAPKRLEDVEVTGRQPGESEQRQPLRQVREAPGSYGCA